MSDILLLRNENFGHFYCWMECPRCIENCSALKLPIGSTLKKIVYQVCLVRWLLLDISIYILWYVRLVWYLSLSGKYDCFATWLTGKLVSKGHLILLIPSLPCLFAFHSLNFYSAGKVWRHELQGFRRFASAESSGSTECPGVRASGVSLPEIQSNFVLNSFLFFSRAFSCPIASFSQQACKWARTSKKGVLLPTASHLAWLWLYLTPVTRLISHSCKMRGRDLVGGNSLLLKQILQFPPLTCQRRYRSRA